MKIATLMSVYARDEPAALAEAITSVATQRFRTPIESRLYLAVDGPLPPALDAVVQAHAAACYRIVRLPSNGGLARALNALIAQLEDETLLFRMDADDVSLPARYQAQIDYLIANPCVDIVGGDMIEHDSASGQQRSVRFPREHADAMRRLSRRVPVAHPTVCMRRTVVERAGNYPVNGTNEDVAFWFNCARAGLRFGNVAQPLLRFNIGPAFWKRRGLRKAFGEFATYVRGIWALERVTWHYVFPLARLLLRLLPSGLVRRAYGSRRLRDHV